VGSHTTAPGGQDLFDDQSILDNVDDPLRVPASMANQRIDYLDFLDRGRPASSTGGAATLRLDTPNSLLPPSPAAVSLGWLCFNTQL
jgi:hypothetical protein